MRLQDIIRLASYIEAKAKHLKAIDFTIGLLRRLQKQDKKFPIPYNVAIERLKEMRKLSQLGFRLDTLMKNVESLRGNKGEAVLDKLEKEESKLLPRQKGLMIDKGFKLN